MRISRVRDGKVSHPTSIQRDSMTTEHNRVDALPTNTDLSIVVFRITEKAYMIKLSS